MNNNVDFNENREIEKVAGNEIDTVISEVNEIDSNLDAAFAREKCSHLYGKFGRGKIGSFISG